MQILLMDAINTDILIAKEKELATLEMRLRNADKPPSGKGFGVFLFFLGIIILLAGMIASSLPVLLLAVLIILTGIIGGANNSKKRADAKEETQKLTNKILEVKGIIIELKNS